MLRIGETRLQSLSILARTAKAPPSLGPSDPMKTPCAWIAAAGATLLWLTSSSAREDRVLHADPSTLLEDSDGDFLPDDLEWCMMTDRGIADTDGDGSGDFLEVVHFDDVRVPGVPAPLNDAMRIVVTSTADGADHQSYWMHMLFRFANGNLGTVSHLVPWIDIMGVRVPLTDLLLSNSIQFVQRPGPAGDLLVRVSGKISRVEILQNLLPAVIGAEAVLGGRFMETGVLTLSMGQTPTVLVPHNDQLIAHTARPQFGHQFQGPSGSGGDQEEETEFFKSNKVCVFQLSLVGASPGGSLLEIVSAECMPANGLDCGSECPRTAGEVVTIPGGLPLLTGDG